jgi:hypothetical protein
MQPTATLDPHPGHATGPRTPEGKAISAMNGEIHGFRGERISHKNPRGQQMVHEKLEQYQLSYKPRHQGETDLLEDMATASVKKILIDEALHRLEQQENYDVKEHGRFSRYHRIANSAYYRALNTLLALRRQQEAENHTRFLDERRHLDDATFVVTHLRKQQVNLPKGKSVFDRPNSQEEFEKLSHAAIATIPRPAHLKKSPPPAAPSPQQ